MKTKLKIVSLALFFLIYTNLTMSEDWMLKLPYSSDRQFNLSLSIIHECTLQWCRCAASLPYCLQTMYYFNGQKFLYVFQSLQRLIWVGRNGCPVYCNSMVTLHFQLLTNITYIFRFIPISKISLITVCLYGLWLTSKTPGLHQIISSISRSE